MSSRPKSQEILPDILLCANKAVLVRFFSCQFDNKQGHLGTSTEKIPLSDWPIGKSVGPFS